MENSLKPGEYLWTFDSKFQDTSATFNGTPVNNATFSSLTITGYGSSLSLNASINQSVSIAQPFLPLYDRSWTFEAWIYLHSCLSGTNCPIIGQRDSLVVDKYLQLMVRHQKLFLGFFDDDLDGVSDLSSSRWYHAAFVFDSTTNNQSIYLDGVLDASRIANSTYKGISGDWTIGAVYWTSAEQYFDGSIDQLSYINQSKSSDEILRDATFALYFSFDGNSILDEGPLRVNGSVAGSTSFVSGRRGQALQICNVPDSYFITRGSVLLGRSDQPYSFSIWINPTIIQQSTIIHMSTYPNGSGWSLPMIGMNNAGQLTALSWNGSYFFPAAGPVVPANSWTHVVSTYSLTYGLRIYVNGSFWNASVPFSYKGSWEPNYLIVGTSRAFVYSAWWPAMFGQYSGAFDELQVYARELTAGEINGLANPGP